MRCRPSPLRNNRQSEPVVTSMVARSYTTPWGTIEVRVCDRAVPDFMVALTRSDRFAAGILEYALQRGGKADHQQRPTIRSVRSAIR
ncbi:MAG: hypothetical protein WCK65_14410 [Rhodospirillaceae bacterium]